MILAMVLETVLAVLLMTGVHVAALGVPGVADDLSGWFDTKSSSSDIGGSSSLSMTRPWAVCASTHPSTRPPSEGEAERDDDDDDNDDDADDDDDDGDG